jgi:hypothetical protein
MYGSAYVDLPLRTCRLGQRVLLGRIGVVFSFSLPCCLTIYDSIQRETLTPIAVEEVSHLS